MLRSAVSRNGKLFLSFAGCCQVSKVGLQSKVGLREAVSKFEHASRVGLQNLQSTYLHQASATFLEIMNLTKFKASSPLLRKGERAPSRLCLALPFRNLRGALGLVVLRELREAPVAETECREGPLRALRQKMRKRGPRPVGAGEEYRRSLLWRALRRFRQRCPPL